jgi:multidrug efflux system membrane fusion protein
MAPWKKATLLGLSLLLVATIGGYRFITPKSQATAASPAEKQAKLVKTALAERRTVPIYVSGIGHVQALNTAQLRSRIDGPIEKVLFTEGSMVTPGKALFQIYARPYQAALAQAEGQLARDQAQYLSARADFERTVSLVEKGFASRQTFEQREAQVSGFSAAIKIDQAALDNARLNLDFTTIRAPIAGRIGKRLIDQGNLVHVTDSAPLAEIVQTKPISVVFTVPQSLLPQMRREMQRGNLVVEAISTDDRSKLSQGNLALIGNQVDPLTGTIELKAAFDNDDEALWPGQLIEARLTLETRNDVVAVPASAVASGAQGKLVFVVGADHLLSVRKVTTGPTSEGRTIIETGLQPGEQVAIEKLDELAAGLRVDPESDGPIKNGAPS